MTILQFMDLHPWSSTVLSITFAVLVVVVLVVVCVFIDTLLRHRDHYREMKRAKAELFSDRPRFGGRF